MRGTRETTFGIRCAIVVTLLREGHLVDWKQAGRSNRKNDPAFWDRRRRKGGLEGQWLCIGCLALQTCSRPGCQSTCVCLSMYRCASAYVCRRVSALCQCVHPQRPGGVHGQREWEERRRVDVNPQRPLLVFSG